MLCRSFTLKRHRQMRVKDLPKVPTWRLERDSNPRHSGRQLSTLPMSQYVPQYHMFGMNFMMSTNSPVGLRVATPRLWDGVVVGGGRRVNEILLYFIMYRNTR